MADAADAVTENEALAMQRFEEQQARDRRIAESMRGHDPTLPLYCDDCGEQIDPERLAAQPLASRCTPCGAAWERDTRARWPR